MMLLPLFVMIFFAKEPPDREHQSLREHLSCLFEWDGWAFNLIYIITFGGFIGLATFLPSFYYASISRLQDPGWQPDRAGDPDWQRNPRRRRLVRGQNRRHHHSFRNFS